MTTQAEWDAYFYPGTTVLRNLPGIQDAAQLAAYESEATADRQADFGRRSVRRAVGVEGVRVFEPDAIKRIHRHLFQDVYPWAGQNRTVGMTKAGTPFADPDRIDATLREASQLLHEKLDARTLGRIRAAAVAEPGEATGRFAFQVAEPVVALNAAHPFREGNGRATRVLLDELARNAGLRFTYSEEQAPAWDASMRAATIDCGDASSVSLQIHRGLSPRPAPTRDRGDRDRDRGLER